MQELEMSFDCYVILKCCCNYIYLVFDNDTRNWLIRMFTYLLVFLATILRRQACSACLGILMFSTLFTFFFVVYFVVMVTKNKLQLWNISPPYIIESFLYFGSCSFKQKHARKPFFSLNFLPFILVFCFTVSGLST